MVRPSLLSRLKRWLNNRERPKELSNTLGRQKPDVSTGRSLSAMNPVHNYYQQVAQTNLSAFNRFALQTRSLAIRDVFAKTATGGEHDLADLIAILESQSGTLKWDLEKKSDHKILLALADLLANGARNDLDTHRAIQIFDLVYEWYGPEPFEDHHKLLYIESIGDQGGYDKLDHLVEEFSLKTLAPVQYDLLLVQKARELSTSVEEWLSVLNELYESLGMSQVQLCGAEA